MRIHHSFMKSIIVNSFVMLGICLLAAGELSAQGMSTAAGGRDLWAEMMFNEMGTTRVHNFGSVALHAEVEHRFQFRNIYKEDVVIQSVSSNCGCTKPSVSKKVVHSMETAEVIARVDTSGKEHTKQRKATVTVIFSKPTYAEVQFQVKTYIRSDVMFDPGVVEFGTIPQGTSVTKTVYLQYEGSPNWEVTGLKKSDPAFKAEAREVERRNGRTVYKIDVTVKSEAEPGYVNDLLHFTTNETNATTASVFLPIHGIIMEPLSAKPSFFQMGIIQPGQKVSKNLVVRSSTPFSIKKIYSEDPRMSFLIANKKSTIHVIPISFTADDHSGSFDDKITIETDQKELTPLDVSISGYISNGEELTSTKDIPKSQLAQKAESLSTKKPDTISSKPKDSPSPLSLSPKIPLRSPVKQMVLPAPGNTEEKGPVPLHIEKEEHKPFPATNIQNNVIKNISKQEKSGLVVLKFPNSLSKPETKKAILNSSSSWRAVDPLARHQEVPVLNVSQSNEKTVKVLMPPVTNWNSQQLNNKEEKEQDNNSVAISNKTDSETESNNNGILFRKPTKVATKPSSTLLR